MDHVPLAATGALALQDQFDGYVLEKPGGWQAEALGVVVGAGLDYEHAVAVAQEHAGDRPVWRVGAGGVTAAA